MRHDRITPLRWLHYRRFRLAWLRARHRLRRHLRRAIRRHRPLRRLGLFHSIIVQIRHRNRDQALPAAIRGSAAPQFLPENHPRVRRTTANRRRTIRRRRLPTRRHSVNPDAAHPGRRRFAGGQNSLPGVTRLGAKRRHEDEHEGNGKTDHEISGTACQGDWPPTAAWAVPSSAAPSMSVSPYVTVTCDYQAGPDRADCPPCGTPGVRNSA